MRSKGKMDDAKSTLAEARSVSPKSHDEMAYLATFADILLKIFEGVRKAGLPEE